MHCLCRVIDNMHCFTIFCVLVKSYRVLGTDAPLLLVRFGKQRCFITSILGIYAQFHSVYLVNTQFLFHILRIYAPFHFTYSVHHTNGRSWWFWLIDLLLIQLGPWTGPTWCTAKLASTTLQLQLPKVMTLVGCLTVIFVNLGEACLSHLAFARPPGVAVSQLKLVYLSEHHLLSVLYPQCQYWWAKASRLSFMAWLRRAWRRSSWRADWGSSGTVSGWMPDGDVLRDRQGGLQLLGRHVGVPVPVHHHGLEGVLH